MDPALKKYSEQKWREIHIRDGERFGRARRMNVLMGGAGVLIGVCLSGIGEMTKSFPTWIGLIPPVIGVVLGRLNTIRQQCISSQDWEDNGREYLDPERAKEIIENNDQMYN